MCKFENDDFKFKINLPYLMSLKVDKTYHLHLFTRLKLLKKIYISEFDKFENIN